MLKFLTLLSFFYFCLSELVPKEDRMLRIRFQFDENLPRLGNTGTPQGIPAGNAGQVPTFGYQSVHYIELTQDKWVQYGDGEVIYLGPTTTDGGESAIDHRQAIIAEENEIFLNISLKDITPGNYTWIRTSIAYQEYTIKWNWHGSYPLSDQTGYIASFLGVNTYIDDVELNGLSQSVNTNKLQGYFGFATDYDDPIVLQYVDNTLVLGQSGGTTVPNLLWGIADVPAGSCVVTGKLVGGLVIPEEPLNNDENLDDILLTLKYSINGSVEWNDTNSNGELDWYEDDSLSENIVDMGTRGLWPVWEDYPRKYVNDSDSDDDDGDDSYGYRIFAFNKYNIISLCILSALLF